MSGGSTLSLAQHAFITRASRKGVVFTPRGQRVKMPGVGHNIHQTRPEAALQVAAEFSSRLRNDGSALEAVDV